jgi:4-amino-4-deoxy-L-arabinose transferase-like glycosyltransferase
VTDRIATRLFLLFLILSVGFRLFYAAFGPLDLVEDEAYYWEWSRHLDWSYYSKGPLVAYLMALSTAVFGVSEWAIRLPSILMGGATMAGAFVLGSWLTGSRGTALLAVLLLSSSPIFIAGSMMLTIDAPLFCFYVLCTMLTWKALNTPGSLRYWVLAGVCLGIGIMAKAAILFYIANLVIFLAWSPVYRNQLKSRGPWVCVAVGLLFFAPQILWNALNDWVMFKDFLFKGGAGRSIPWTERNPFLFFATQAGVLSPLLFVGVLLALRHGWLRVKAQESAPAQGLVAKPGVRALHPEAARFLVSFTLPILFFFFLLSFRVPINPNWPIIGYFTGILLLAAWLRWLSLSLFRAGLFGKVRTLRIVVTAGVLLGAVPSYALFATDVFHQFKLPNNGRIDPTNRLAEWEQFGEKITEMRREYEKQGPLFLSAKYYQETALLAFYSPDHPTTYCFEHNERNNQYYFLIDFNDVVGQNSLFVARRKSDLRHVERAFESVEKVGPLILWRGVNPIIEYDVYFCRNFKGWTYQEKGSK